MALELHAPRKIITELAASKKPHDYRSVLTSLANCLFATPGASKEHPQWRLLKTKWEAAGSDARFAVLDAFLPGLIQPVTLGARPFDAAFVEDSLKRYGPLYASVYRPGAAPMDMDYVADPFPRPDTSINTTRRPASADSTRLLFSASTIRTTSITPIPTARIATA